MEEMFIAIILRGVIEALAYLHEKEKIHRDIKGTTQKLEKNSKFIPHADFSGKYLGLVGRRSKTSRFWCFSAIGFERRQTTHSCWHTLLDGP